MNRFRNPENLAARNSENMNRRSVSPIYSRISILRAKHGTTLVLLLALQTSASVLVLKEIEDFVVMYYPGQKKEPSSRFAARRKLFHV